MSPATSIQATTENEVFEILPSTKHHIGAG